MIFRFDCRNAFGRPLGVLALTRQARRTVVDEIVQEKRRFYQSELHVLNFLKKQVRENPFLEGRTIPLGEAARKLWSREDCDDACLCILKDPELLLDSKRRRQPPAKTPPEPEGVVYYKEYGRKLSPQFEEAMEDLVGAPGVYSIYDRRELVYIGKSVDLGSRVLNSFKEKKSRLKRDTHGHAAWAVTKTASDASVIESILIAYLKPDWNSDGKHADTLTLDLAFDPDEFVSRMTRPLQIYRG